MKIYQVEELVGITKKNIRFYEEQGLLCPKRNPENDYREYSLADVKVLEKIKLFRKLSVPIEEIRLVQKGNLSIEQCMQKQIERIEQEEHNAQVMKNLCYKIKDEAEDIKTLNASDFLMEMEKMEREGTRFTDITKEDINRKKKSGAAACAVIFCIFMILVILLLIYSVKQESKALFPVLFATAILVALIIGTIIVLVQRFREIDKGEEFEARKY